MKPRAVGFDKGKSELNSILNENKGLAKIYDPGKVSVVFASPERLSELKKAGRGSDKLEYWSPGEEGASNFKRPSGNEGKHILEIYDKELQNNPERLKDAIYGDLLHGMDSDSYYSALKKQFTQNYTSEMKAFNEKGIKSGKFNRKELDDMYIRGRLAKGQGDEWSDSKRYSSKQLEILDKMRKYIKTGEK